MTTQANEVIHLWAGEPPTTLNGVGNETTFQAPVNPSVQGKMLRNVSEPALTVYRSPPTANRMVSA